MDFIGDRTPAVSLLARSLNGKRCRRAIEGDPGHHFRMNEVLTSAADLPNAFVRLSPGLSQILQDQRPHSSTALTYFYACLPRQSHCINHLTGDVDLKLLVRRIADPNRRGI